MNDTISAPIAVATTWHDKAAELSIDGRPVINGEQVDALSGRLTRRRTRRTVR